jgi:superfamily II DNA or RNA helicase
MATLRGDPTTDVDETDDRKLQLMLFERARIIKSAAAKVPAAVEIVIDEGLSRCLVYCDTEAQLDSLGAALEARGISLAAYTYRVSGRDLALDRFSRGHVDVLLAIKCLDEGVDLPWCRDALILASSSDSAEFIQRRGRILRRHPDKAFARVYDLSVLPFDPELGPGSTQRFGHTEISILKKEMRRIQLFLEDAENSVTEQARILEIRRMITELS